MKVCTVFSLESPHRGDSAENIQHTIFYMKKQNHLKLSQICSYSFFSKRLKNEFETAVVNEPSVFESLKAYCSTSQNRSGGGVVDYTRDYQSRVARSIPRFSSLSDETVNRGSVSV